MSSQRDIIDKVRDMRPMDLLQVILKHPYFLTDAYFTEIAKAVRVRYEQLNRGNATRR